MNKWEKYLIEGGTMPELELMDVPEPDVDATEERLFELYLEECERNHLKASFKDYLVWVEERS